MLKIKNILLAVTLLFATSMAAQKAPQISTDELVFNFGNIAEADGLASHVFVIKNTGNAPLVINRITASCGCTQPEWTKEPIPGGGTGEVKITYNPKGRPGPFYKTVSIFSNAKKGSYNLAIKGDVSAKVADIIINYPYSIGNLKMDTKKVLFSSIHQEEMLVEKIAINNSGNVPLSLSVGKVPDYLSVTFHPKTITSHETGEIDLLMNARAAKKKGRVGGDIDLIVKAIGQREVTGKIEVRANIIDNFSKLSSSDKAEAPVAQLSGTLLEFGNLSDGSKSVKKGKLTGTFDITNAGKSNLTIYSITCDDPSVEISGMKKELRPRQKATIKVSIRPSEIKNRLETLVNVVCNDPNGPIRLIKVTGYK
jgi:hypothetical protein